MQQLRCQAIIFDLDGVLIDSSAVVQRQWRRWTSVHSLGLEQTVNVMHGQRLVEIIHRVAPYLDAEQEAARLAAWEAADTNGLHTMKSTAGLIASLPDGDWAVVTSGNRDTAMTRLSYAELPIPAVLVTADDVTHGKPHPEPYLLAAHGLGVRPADCVVVEDAPSGVTAARAASMRVIAVTTTHAPETLKAADVIISGLLNIQVLPARHETDLSTGPADTILYLAVH